MYSNHYVVKNNIVGFEYFLITYNVDTFSDLYNKNYVERKTKKKISIKIIKTIVRKYIFFLTKTNLSKIFEKGHTDGKTDDRQKDRLTI